MSYSIEGSEQLRLFPLTPNNPSAFDVPVTVNALAAFIGGGGAIPNASLLGGTGSAFTSITLGTNLSITGGILNATGGGTPGGSAGQIQINNSGAFGGITTTGTGSAVLGTAPTIGTPAITGGTADNIVIGGTTPAVGTFTNLSFGNTSVIKSGTAPVFSVYTSVGTTCGVYAGQNAGGMGGIVGNNNWSMAGTENVGIGNNAGQWLSSGVDNTFVGQSTGGQETTGGYNAVLGNDAMRNTNGISGSVAIGRSSYRNYMGSSSVAIGYEALQGNFQSVTITGTATASDVISLVFTSTAITGSPVTVNYTVTGGQSDAQMATSVAAAVNAVTAVSQQFAAFIYAGTNVITFEAANLNGPAAAQSLTITPSVTPAASFTGTVTTNTTLTVSGVTGTIAIGQTVYNSSGVALATVVSGTGPYTITSTANVGPISMTSSTEGIAVGVCATTNTYNTAVGYTAMQGGGLTSANYNVAVGASALQLLTSGSENVSIGALSGFVLTTGTQNVYVGHSAGQSATTSNGCIGIGYQALLNFTTGTNTVAVGSAAGAALTVAMNNTLVGTTAGGNITTGASNTAIGSGALKGGASSTAALNVAAGVNSLSSISSGAGNVSIGYGAGGAISTGSYNVLIGYQAWGSVLNTGSNNIAICAGNSPLYAPANASDTLFIGVNAIPAISGTTLQTAGSVSIAIPNGLLTVGTASTYGGSLVLEGATSGSFTLSTNSTGVPKMSTTAFTANGSVATVLGSLGPTGAGTTVAEWLTIVDASGTTRYIPCF